MEKASCYIDLALDIIRDIYNMRCYNFNLIIFQLGSLPISILFVNIKYDIFPLSFVVMETTFLSLQISHIVPDNQNWTVSLEQLREKIYEPHLIT